MKNCRNTLRRLDASGYIMKPTKADTSNFDQVLSARQVEGLITSGHSIIILDQKVLKVDAWIKYHPGGHKTIEHMVGKDATDEITVLE